MSDPERRPFDQGDVLAIVGLCFLIPALISWGYDAVRAVYTHFNP